MGSARQQLQDVLGADDGEQVRLGVAVEGGEQHGAAGLGEIRAGADGGGRVGDVFEHLHADNHVEVAGLPCGQVFDGDLFILGRGTAFQGVQSGHLQRLVGQVHAQRGGSACLGQGFGEDAAAAAHVHHVEAGQAAAGLLDNPFQAQRVDVVQGLELAVGVPPPRGERLELVEFGLVDVGGGAAVDRGRVGSGRAGGHGGWRRAAGRALRKRGRESALAGTEPDEECPGRLGRKAVFLGARGDFRA